MMVEEELSAEQLVRDARKAKAEFHKAEQMFEAARIVFEEAHKKLDITTQISCEARRRLFTYFDKELDKIQEN